MAFYKTHIGTAGTRTQEAGNGLNLQQIPAGYTLASTAIAMGGAGYSYLVSPTLSSGGIGGDGGIGVHMAAGKLTNYGNIAGANGGTGFGATHGGNGGDGVYFAGAGELMNFNNISGGAGAPGASGGTGVEMKARGVIVNTAAISGGAGALPSNGFNGGTGGIGIKLDQHGNLFNSGVVSGGNGGSAAYAYFPGYLGGAAGAGIVAQAGGNIVNTGKIDGGNGGEPHPSFEAFNYGANGADGLDLGGGYLANYGVIAGGNAGNAGGNGGDGVVLSGSITKAVNFGSIYGGSGTSPGHGELPIAGTGVDMKTAGTFVNYGIIHAGSGSNGAEAFEVSGIYLAGGSTLVNDGTIFGDPGGFGVRFGNAGSSRLIIDAAANFSGYVEAGGANNVMELTGNQFGTVANFGFNFGAGFQTLQVDAGSSWSVSGVVSGDLDDSGLVEIQDNEKLDISGAVDLKSTGIFVLTGKSSLEIAKLLGTHAKIEFLGSSPTNLLTIDTPADFGLRVGAHNYAGPLLQDFAAGDTIDLKGIGNTGLTLEYKAGNGLLQITSSSGGVVASLKFQNASLGAGSFHLTTDNTGGSLLTLG